MLGAVAAAPVAPPRRLTRALALTATSAAVAVGAHVAGGGAVSLVGVAAALPVLLALAWLLADRERDWLAIGAAQIAGQQVVHSALGWTEHPGAAHGLPVDMLLYTHVVGAALMAAWLRCGERRAWGGGRRAARSLAARMSFLLALLGRDARPRHASPCPRSVPPPTFPRTHLRHAVARRGPPAHV